MATILRTLGLGDGAFVNLRFDDVAMTFDGFAAHNPSGQNLRLFCSLPQPLWSWSIVLSSKDPDVDRVFSPAEKITWEWVDVWNEDLGETVQVVGGFDLYATLGN